MIGTTLFFRRLLSNKITKREISDRFSWKTRYIIERLFSQNVTVFYDRYSVFFNRLLDKKRTKLKTSSRFSGRDPYHRTSIFTKRNGFL